MTGILGDSFGGLGFFIFEGYRHSFPTEIVFGAVPLDRPGDRRRLRARPAPASADAVDAGRRPRPTTRRSRRRPRRGRWSSSARRRVADRPGQLAGPRRHPDAARRAHRSSRRRRSLIAIADRPADRALTSATPGGAPRVAVNVANLGRALPSLAVIGHRAAGHGRRSTRSSGFKVYPTLIAMVVLACRRSSSTPTPASPASIATSSRRPAAMGMRERQRPPPGRDPGGDAGDLRRRPVGGDADRRDGDARRDLRRRRAWAASSSRASPRTTTG